MTGGVGFAYRDDALCCDGVRLQDIVAEHGTPTYVYSAASIRHQLAQLQSAFATVPHRICYAVKTNSNLAVLELLATAGAGFDIVSGGELHRLMHLHVPGSRIVFAGVGKSRDEMTAALAAAIGTFNVESIEEATALSQVAASMGRTARIAVRINPGVEAGGHQYISTGTSTEKFGIPIDEIAPAWEALNGLPALVIRGLHCHVGSQILDPATFASVAATMRDLVVGLRTQGGIIEELNLGGGFGIRYRDESPPSAAAVAAAILPAIRDLGVRLLLEPGRSIVGASGVLVARVLYRKVTGSKTFVIVDAGMNDLVRPSLYGAHHDIAPLAPARDRAIERVDVVGPLCEAGDFLARQRDLVRLEPGECIAIGAAGAYGFAMSSNYNSRPRAAEVLVDEQQARLVRRRETFDDLIAAEQCGLRSSEAQR